MRAQQRALLARKEEEDAKKAASQRLSAPLLHGGGGRGAGGAGGAGGEGAQQVSETSTGGGGASRKIYPKLPTIPRRTRPITEAVPGDMAVQIVRASPVFTNTGQQVTGPSQRNVQINKQIIDCQNSTHLCALIGGQASRRVQPRKCCDWLSKAPAEPTRGPLKQGRGANSAGARRGGPEDR